MREDEFWTKIAGTGAKADPAPETATGAVSAHPGASLAVQRICSRPSIPWRHAVRPRNDTETWRDSSRAGPRREHNRRPDLPRLEQIKRPVLSRARRPLRHARREAGLSRPSR